MKTLPTNKFVCEDCPNSDLEKVVNRPQAEKPELNNVLKIAGLTTMDEQKYVYQMLVWHDAILKS